MDKHDKEIRLTFYIVCGLLLGAPFFWKIIKILPELIKMIPNITDILSAFGYAGLVVISMVIAFKLKEALWLKIVGIYASAGLILGILNLIFGSVFENSLFEILFSIFCAPFIGVDSDFIVMAVMLLLTVASYSLINKIPQKSTKNTHEQTNINN